jgi:hypothetical protein
VVLAAEIHAVVPCGTDGRSAVQGTILTTGHPVHDTHVGQAPPRRSDRNPVKYVDSPLDTRTCGCGCGLTVDVETDFVSGHAHQAVQQRVRRAGGVVEFLTWFDKTWSAQP